MADAILQEAGAGYILMEDGSKILLEGTSSGRGKSLQILIGVS